MGLVLGLVIAAPSAMAVVLAVAKGGFNAIVGTAISVSLLPPVVNCGLCFGMATVYSFSEVASHDTAYYIRIGLVSAFRCCIFTFRVLF
jgi:hypothetical protein